MASLQKNAMLCCVYFAFRARHTLSPRSTLETPLRKWRVCLLGVSYQLTDEQQLTYLHSTDAFRWDPNLNLGVNKSHSNKIKAREFQTAHRVRIA